MTFKELVAQLTVGNVAAGIAVLLSLIQISPLKLNPWDKLLAWFGKKLNGSTEKRLEELQKQLQGIEVGKPESVGGRLVPILSNAMIFGSDLSQTPLAERIETYFREEITGPGAVRTTLQKYLK